MRDPAAGDHLDQYELGELLARGGMASVWKAVDLASGDDVVLKIPHLQYESDVVFYQRFEREDEIGRRLWHPNIVRVLAPKERSRLYLVMEYVPGRSLAEVLAAEGPLPLPRALAVACQLAGALACLEENGVVHRDVKPSNVRVMPSGQVKLLDFGIALLESARRLTWSGLAHAIGTPDYMAPEQIRGRRGDARTDVYALGTLLYEMLTGRLPFAAGDVAAVLDAKQHGEPTPPSAHLPSLDPALEAVILRALAHDPRDRHSGASELLFDLRDPPPVGAVVVARARRSRLGTRARRRLVATLVAGAIVAGLGTLVLAGRADANRPAAAAAGHGR